METENEIEFLKLRCAVLDSAVQEFVAIFAQTATPDQLDQINYLGQAVNQVIDNINAQYDEKRKAANASS